MSAFRSLVGILHEKGALARDWRDAVASVDRGQFIPDRFADVDRAKEPERWHRLVYSDRPIVTQVNGGEGTHGGDGVGEAQGLPTSSSSMPSIMLEMLSLLQITEGGSVLEIGTGTGYNAAWLAHRLGDGKVTTVEFDAVVAEQAVKNLATAGFSPYVVTGDGLNGCPQHAPYDGVLATCTVREIPYAWVEQARPRARIVTPWGNGFFSGSFASLEVKDGQAQGTFSGNPAFMFARQQQGRRPTVGDVYHGEEGRTGRTGVDPREVLSDDALFYVGLFLEHAAFAWCNADDDSGEGTLWLLANDRRSWATAEYSPDRDSYETDQYGPQSLWNEVEAAHHRWSSLGRPGRDRFGLTVDRRGQRVWLDEPGNLVAEPT